MSPNVAAFLTMLARSEGTEKPWIAGRDSYKICFLERHVIQSFSMHPAWLGEWDGEVITQGKYAGEKSTAAGRYQINVDTYRQLAKRLRNWSFNPSSQDDMAVQLLKDKNAFGAVNAGDIETAMHMCSPTWASLPFSDAGQHKQDYELLVDIYSKAGGVLVA